MNFCLVSLMIRAPVLLREVDPMIEALVIARIEEDQSQKESTKFDL